MAKVLIPIVTVAGLVLCTDGARGNPTSGDATHPVLTRKTARRPIFEPGDPVGLGATPGNLIQSAHHLKCNIVRRNDDALSMEELVAESGLPSEKQLEVSRITTAIVMLPTRS